MDLDPLNAMAKRLTLTDLLGWSHEQFGDSLAVTSSFQTQSVPLLHMLSQTCPEVPVYFLDTGFHFDETYSFVELLTNEFGLNVVYCKGLLNGDDFLRKYGKLYKKDPNLCCHLNKIEPLSREMKGMKAWIAGVRRDQTAFRKELDYISRQDNGMLKICPMLDWNSDDVTEYIESHSLPKHPLHDKGYKSIGCAPCTSPSIGLSDERAGRWKGASKTECGLHFR